MDNIQNLDLNGSPASLIELINNLCRPTVDVDGLADILGISPATVFTKLNRTPHELPPRILLPGKTKKVLWLRSAVMKWLESHQEAAPMRRATSPINTASARGRGRPPKLLQGQGGAK